MASLSAPDRVTTIPAGLADFTRQVDLRRVVIGSDQSISIGGQAGLNRLTEDRQTRLMEILTHVSKFLEQTAKDPWNNTELRVNLKIIPAAVGRPSTEYIRETNTVLLQVIHLTDALPLAYSLLIAHHEFIEHVHRGHGERRAAKGTRALLEIDIDTRDALMYMVLRAKPIVEPRRIIKKLITSDIGFQKDEIKFIIHDLRVISFFDWFVSLHETVGATSARYNNDTMAVGKAVETTRKTRKEYERAVKSFRSDEKIVVRGMGYIEAVDNAIATIQASRLIRQAAIATASNDDGGMDIDPQELDNRLKWIEGIHIRIGMFNQQFQAGETKLEQFSVLDVFEYYVTNRLQPYVAERTARTVELVAGRMEDGFIQGNASRFMRVIFNLVMNAVDAMDNRNGTITLSAEHSKRDLVVYVADTGRGMSSPKIRQLLTPRRDLDGELHSLGFEFVKRTIANMGGVINIDSVLGTGTTLKITLPQSDKDTLYIRELPRVESLVIADIATATTRETDSTTTPEPDVSDEDEQDDQRYGEIILANYRKSPKGFRGAAMMLSANLENPEPEIEYFRIRAYEKDSEVPHEILDPYFYKVGIRGRYTDYYDGFKKHGTALILKTPFVADIEEYHEFHGFAEKLRKQSYFRGMLHDELILIARVLVGTGLPETTPTMLEVQLETMFGVYGQMPENEIFSLTELAGIKTLRQMKRKYDWVP